MADTFFARHHPTSCWRRIERSVALNVAQCTTSGPHYIPVHASACADFARARHLGVLITNTGRVARQGEARIGFRISVESERAILALGKAITGELIAQLPTMSNQPVCAADEPQTDVVEVGALVIDTKAFDVTDDGVPVTLKPREYALLLALARGAGHAFTREKLLEVVWPLDAAIKTDDRTVDVHIRRLRIKLGSSASRIETINSVGYRLSKR